MNNNDRVILKERGINMLFVLGGNGTQAGGNAIHNENWFEKKNAKGPYGHITLGDISVHIEQQENSNWLHGLSRFMEHLLDIVALQWAYAILSMSTFQFLKFLTPGKWILTVACGIIT
ncbi:PREDICTED: uncharacterized protein LOC104608607 isoform X2 [Nelumbo nucifera]|uniref:Uncharacterized protein n=2 Tax=Nelumbo nucifera TaxID=4432 RepID=A0A822XXE0_NELNU|nr:PREDICTED: uncharacterized protein LOC104608607 isoform X2 [Nelumbo nucifera]DAD22068.1 TPA_asm: hypothetical protein HUJ06_023531 [Nelumbo nucifera]